MEICGLRCAAQFLHTRKLGQTFGLDVACGVDLPLMDRAAGGTGPDGALVADRLPYSPAGGTGPRGGEIAVHRNKSLPLPRQFVAQADPEHSKPRSLALPFQLVAEQFPEHTVPGGGDEPQRFQSVRPHAHRVPGVGYPPGFLVQKILPLIGYVFMQQTVLLDRCLVIP